MTSNQLSGRERRWLEAAALGAGSGLYAGWHWDAAPKVFTALERRGLVRLSEPANRSHKARAVATFDGLEALK